MLSGCALFSPAAPKDLRLVSVSLTNYRDEPEMRQIGHEPRRSLPLLKIEFSSATDLLHFAHQHEMSVYNRATICDRHLWPFFGVSSVYWKNIEVWPYSDDPKALPCTDCLNTGFLYHVYFGVSESNPEFMVYDLRQQPADICFRVESGDMLGRHSMSNVVVIPKEAIAEVLSTAK